MERIRFSLRGLMLVTAVVAVLFAFFGVYTGLALSAVLLVTFPVPIRSRWQVTKLAIGLVWFLEIAKFSSEMWNDMRVILFNCYIPCGFLLGLSWLIREYPTWKTARPRPVSLILPSLLLLAGLLMATSDLAFRRRLTLSEVSLRANALTISPGVTKPAWPSDRVGLFRVSRAESWNGCVFWYAKDWWVGESGLVLVPGGEIPVRPQYDFHNVRGDWWKFTVVYQIRF